VRKRGGARARVRPLVRRRIMQGAACVARPAVPGAALPSWRSQSATAACPCLVADAPLLAEQAPGLRGPGAAGGGGAHGDVHGRVERAEEPDVAAGREADGGPPAGEEGGRVVVHVQQRDLPVVLARHHDGRVHKLIRLRAAARSVPSPTLTLCLRLRSTMMAMLTKPCACPRMLGLEPGRQAGGASTDTDRSTCLCGPLLAGGAVASKRIACSHTGACVLCIRMTMARCPVCFATKHWHAQRLDDMQRVRPAGRKCLS